MNISSLNGFGLPAGKKYNGMCPALHPEYTDIF